MDKTDRPAHMLEIPDSLGRDIDKGLTPPIEAFMSDDALSQAEAMTRAASEPVHAEDMVPISRAEAGMRTTMSHGDSLLRAPATRRVIPAPYQRDRIAISHHGCAWTSCRADEVDLGNIVPDIGKVVSTEITTRRGTISGVQGVALGMDVRLRGAGGLEKLFDAAATVRVFRETE